MRTISELAEELGVAQHILRYWETRFPQLRPLTRAGNRRYYRPADVALAHRIHQLLNRDGFTVKGAQQALASKDVGDVEAPVKVAPSAPVVIAPVPTSAPAPALDLSALRAVRDRLCRALEGDLPNSPARLL
nr:MerR family transcriptional regulator [Aquisediminimonas sediminicola]